MNLITSNLTKMLTEKTGQRCMFTISAQCTLSYHCNIAINCQAFNKPRHCSPVVVVAGCRGDLQQHLGHPRADREASGSDRGRGGDDRWRQSSSAGGQLLWRPSRGNVHHLSGNGYCCRLLVVIKKTKLTIWPEMGFFVFMLFLQLVPLEHL